MNTTLKRAFAYVLTIAMLLTCLPVFQAQAVDSIYDVEITNVEKQVMDGLGGAIAFNKAYPLNVWNETNPQLTQELMDLMFDEETGIGMDIVRIIVGSGGITNAATGAEWGNRWYDGPSDTIWPEEGEENIVWNQPDWEEKKDSFDPDQIWFCQTAQEYGVDTIYATAWTPPYWMKENKSVLGNSGSYLRDDCFDDYAKYLMEFALGYYREFGVHITHIGPTNECEMQHGGYDGFLFYADDYTKFLTEYLPAALEEYTPKFEELGIEPPIIVAPEGTNLGASAGRTYGGMMQNADVQEIVGVFSTHLYGSANMFENGPQVAPANNWPEWLENYTLWQTEYMTQNGANSSANSNTQVYENQTISDAVYWANLITNCFTSEPGFNAWLWWWPWGNNGADGSDLIRACTNGQSQSLGDTATPLGLYRIFKRFYAFGNFARFVNSGDIRVDATRVPADGINLSAYKDPTTGEFKIVVVNTGDEDRTLSFNFAEDFPLNTTAAIGYRTSASENQKRLDPIAIQDGSFTAEIPAQTVITFVAENGDNLPGLTAKRDIWSTLEAEDNDGISGERRYTADGESVIAMNGQYLCFANINFADGSANGGIVRRHVLSMRAIAAPATGGIIYLRLDDPWTGPIVGEFTIPSGDGSTYQEYMTQIDTGDIAANGYHDLYAVFAGDGKELFAIDRFEFDDEVIEYPDLIANGSFEEERITGVGWWQRIEVIPTADGWTSESNIEASNVQNYSAPFITSSATAACSLMVDGGTVSTDIGLLEDGGTYRLDAFILTGASASDATATLVYLDADGEELDRVIIAERDGLTEKVWGQLCSVFTYSDLDLNTLASLRLEIREDSGNTYYIDEVSLIPYVDKRELISVLNTTYDKDSFTQADLEDLEDAMDAGWALIPDVNATWTDIADAIKKIREELSNGIYVPEPEYPQQPDKPSYPPVLPPEDETEQDSSSESYTNPYDDVDSWDWFYACVTWADENGIIDGLSAYRFGPNEPCTRWTVVSALYNLSGKPFVYGSQVEFSDVSASSDYADAITWAVKEGIAYGYGDGTFGPNDTITREQLAAFLYRYAQYRGLRVNASGDLSVFTDAGQVSAYALDSVKWAVGAGVVSGMGNGTIAPQGTATRAEIASMLMRFAQSYIG